MGGVQLKKENKANGCEIYWLIKHMLA
jgi:hypothetical protein